MQQTDDQQSALAVALMDYEMGNKANAEIFYREILKKNAACSEAYLGLMLLTDYEKWEQYLSRFKQCTGTKMSDAEKKTATENTAVKLMEIYASAGDAERVAALCEAFPETTKDPLAADAAILHKNVPFLRTLLKHGLSANASEMIKSKQEKTIGSLLYRAIVDAKSLELSKLLVEARAEINAVNQVHCDNGDYKELSLLSWAVIESKDAAIVKLLLEHGADPNTTRLYRKKPETSIIARFRMQSAMRKIWKWQKS